ncbi:NPCBM/NEW2 domain-containing protein, partial [Streptomyces fuscigenes]|uniref:NPCBM/NEW2 domain-containing protein n=1 Tax=Streptomyces fuscigenes TaxID=1528880 RepID=UPI001F42D958
APPAPDAKAPAPKPHPASPSPSHHATPAPHAPAPATPSPPSTPRAPSPSRTSAPPSPPPPPPPPAEFPVDQLLYAAQGDGTKPEIRLASAGRLWQRHRMSVAGTHYGSGVSMHGPGSATIDLNRPCTTYRASVGVDDATLGLGALRFSVYGDSGPLWTSPVVRAGRPAVPVSVPLAGQRTIRLVVRPVTPLGAVAIGDWAQARISCG